MHFLFFLFHSGRTDVPSCSFVFRLSNDCLSTAKPTQSTATLLRTPASPFSPFLRPTCSLLIRLSRLPLYIRSSLPLGFRLVGCSNLPTFSPPHHTPHLLPTFGSAFRRDPKSPSPHLMAQLALDPRACLMAQKLGTTREWTTPAPFDFATCCRGRSIARPKDVSYLLMQSAIVTELTESCALFAILIVLHQRHQIASISR